MRLTVRQLKSVIREALSDYKGGDPLGGGYKFVYVVSIKDYYVGDFVVGVCSTKSDAQKLVDYIHDEYPHTKPSFSSKVLDIDENEVRNIMMAQGIRPKGY